MISECRPGVHGSQDTLHWPLRHVYDRMPRMARRPDPRETAMLSEENLAELRHNLAHLSLPDVRDSMSRRTAIAG
jgi:hypothetical protein